MQGTVTDRRAIVVAHALLQGVIRPPQDEEWARGEHDDWIGCEWIENPDGSKIFRRWAGPNPIHGGGSEISITPPELIDQLIERYDEVMTTVKRVIDEQLTILEESGRLERRAYGDGDREVVLLEGVAAVAALRQEIASGRKMDEFYGWWEIPYASDNSHVPAQDALKLCELYGNRLQRWQI